MATKVPCQVLYIVSIRIQAARRVSGKLPVLAQAAAAFRICGKSSYTGCAYKHIKQSGISMKHSQRMHRAAAVLRGTAQPNHSRAASNHFFKGIALLTGKLYHMARNGSSRIPLRQQKVHVTEITIRFWRKAFDKRKSAPINVLFNYILSHILHCYVFDKVDENPRNA